MNIPNWCPQTPHNPIQMNVTIAIIAVIISCCVNVIFLEAIIRVCPGSGNLITFSQFAFIAVEGFIFTTNFGRKQPVIPIKKYISLVILFFLVSVSNNYALNFNISVPLHIIFRSGSLLANMILGILILKRDYSWSKYLSVTIVTIGIIMATLASSHTKSTNSPQNSDSTPLQLIRAYDFAIGITLLTFALFASARCGIFQEVLFTTYGKHAKEALFYQHALSLPGFLLMLPDIYNQTIIFNSSELITFLNIPRLWVYLIINMITQYSCIMFVMILMTECTSLTVTLVLTIRKFISLIFSIYYFNNPFTLTHWLSTCMVFLGGLLFMDLKVINDFLNSIVSQVFKGLHFVKYQKLVTEEKVIIRDAILHETK